MQSRFTTPVSIPAQPFDLSYCDKLLLAGSCFAEEIGQLLLANKFDADVNPFGVLYNPASLEASLRRLMHPEPFALPDLFLHEEMYHSFAHHSRFSSPSPDAALEAMNRQLQISSSRLKETTRLVITWGTAFVYKLKSNGQVVSNCHKLPAGYFTREQLSVEDIASAWQSLLEEIREWNPKLKLILTVSPIRHWKEGAHGNQLSKSALLLAADRLQQACPGLVAYFPAYEIMMDELRDYRFYAGDMLHPSPQAVDYIWERFRQSFFAPDTQTAYDLWQPVRKALEHTPVNPGSEAHRRFITQTLLKAEQLSKKFPFFDISNDWEI
ncbi:hypothetical protein FACS1894181_16010 [Bacteroidia bacterium]|nr:hypothetical protein FACS1894181_16010 [Bacteroidia bacterium]